MLTVNSEIQFPKAFVAFFASAFSRSLQNPEQVTIDPMLLAVFAMRVLTWMFFVGLVGSAVVVLISFWEDGKELFCKD